MTEPKNEESKMRCSDDAEERFQKWKDRDPYPDIFPALLNSADIHDYIETTGMVYPYDPSLMKSSSYEARIGDSAYLWDESGERKQPKFDSTPTVKLEPNSLVFFETKEEFRLPSYMAIRFNLRITNVHRGLLLGTGPLVDPGFEGKLLIPIHNLTNNTYCFEGGEKFIWIEFTKISPNDIWEQKPKITIPQRGVYEPFPKGKKNLKPPAYFEKANKGNRIQNAVPEALFKVEEIANAAEEQAKKATKRVDIITVGGIIAAFIAVIGFYPLIADSVELSKDVSSTISEFRKEYEGDIRDKITGQQSQLDALGKQVDALQIELNRYRALPTPPSPPGQ